MDLKTITYTVKVEHDGQPQMDEDLNLKTITLPNWEYYRRREPSEIPQKCSNIMFVSKDEDYGGNVLFDVFYSKSSWPIWDTDILWWAYLYLPEGKE